MKDVIVVLGGGPSLAGIVNEIRKSWPKLEILQCCYGVKHKDITESEYCKVRLGNEVEMIREKLGARKLKGVVNRYDSYIPLHGKLVVEFGVEGPSLEALEYFRYKAKLHELMETNGLSEHRPKTKIVLLDEVEEVLGEIGWPCVVKPTIGAKSRGVWVLKNQDEWRRAKGRIERHYADPKMKRILKESVVLVEEYIDGFQIAPVTMVDKHGNVEIVGGVDVRRGPDVGEEHIQNVYRTTPSILSEDKLKEVRQLLGKLMKLAGLKSSFLDPELYLLGERIVVIEINVRLGGFREELFKLAYGIDLNRAIIQLALGEEVDLEKKRVGSTTACEVWEDRTGKLAKFELPEGYEYHYLENKFKKGDEYLAPPEGDKPLASFYLTDGENSVTKALEMRKKVKIEFE